MSTGVTALEENCSSCIESRSAIESCLGDFPCGTHWFAVWTKSRQEKVAAAMIGSLGVTNFLPLKSESRQWSDRKQTVNVPLFSGYLFVRMSLSDGSKRRVLRVPGVAGFVGNSHGPLPIPEDQIEAVRTLVERGIECTVYPSLEEGDKVRVIRGPLAGLEGKLIRTNSLTRFVISISMIHRSLSVHVDRGDVERLEDCAAALESARSFGEAPSQVRDSAYRLGDLEKEYSMNIRKIASRVPFAVCAAVFGLLAGQAFCQTQSVAGSGPVLEQRHPRYVLQREDVLLVSFPLSPELNQTVTIQPDGYISLQNMGSVYAQGLTAPELVEAVKKAYGGILHDPIVNIDVQDFQKPFFTVSGQVGKPGQYELRSDVTVAEAIAVAGGMTMMTAKTQVFLFHRSSKDWMEVRKVNLHDVLNGKNVNEDAMVSPGDMIYVPEKFIAKFKKYVPYSINAVAGWYGVP